MVVQGRLHLNTNDGRFVEVPDSMTGKRYLETLRAGRADLFAHQRITSVLQRHADRVPLGVLVSTETPATEKLEVRAAVVAVLQEIHDDADHILGTEATGRDFRVVATDDARRIRALAKDLLEILNS